MQPVGESGKCAVVARGRGLGRAPARGQRHVVVGMVGRQLAQARGQRVGQRGGGIEHEPQAAEEPLGERGVVLERGREQRVARRAR